MAITTVGLALEFAGKLEKQVKSVYQQLADSTDNEPLKEQVMVSLEMSDKRKVALKRLYDDHVYSDMDTGVLAPIGSMETKDYIVSVSSFPESIDEGLLECMTECEKKLERFYSDLSSRLQSGPRTILRRIEKMAQEIGGRIGTQATMGEPSK